MATIEKRGNGYRITVSAGYDMNGKQIRRKMTWTPDEKMTARQVQKELQKQQRCSSPPAPMSPPYQSVSVTRTRLRR